jgi:hypothetical protein
LPGNIELALRLIPRIITVVVLKRCLDLDSRSHIRRVPLYVIYEGWVIVKPWSAPGGWQG